MNKGIWTKFGSMAPEMAKIVCKAKALVARSKSTNTIKKYADYWNRFVTWTTDRKFSSLPAGETTVGLYLAELAETFRSVSVANAHIYAIKWAHDSCGVKDPTSHSFVQMITEGAKRSIIPSPSQKLCFDTSLVSEICGKFCNANSSLREVRFSTMCILAYAGFMRISEILTLKRYQVILDENWMKLSLPVSKTDTYRQGNEIFISKGISHACPLGIMVKYLNMAKIKESEKESFLFRRISPYKKHDKLNPINKPLCYSRARDELKYYMVKILAFTDGTVSGTEVQVQQPRQVFLTAC